MRDELIRKVTQAVVEALQEVGEDEGCCKTADADADVKAKVVTDAPRSSPRCICVRVEGRDPKE